MSDIKQIIEKILSIIPLIKYEVKGSVLEVYKLYKDDMDELKQTKFLDIPISMFYDGEIKNYNELFMNVLFPTQGEKINLECPKSLLAKFLFQAWDNALIGLKKYEHFIEINKNNFKIDIGLKLSADDNKKTTNDIIFVPMTLHKLQEK